MNQMRVSVPPFSKTLKVLIGLNLGAWLIGQFLLEQVMGVPFSAYLSLVPGLVYETGFVWQLFTYMFLHSTSSIMHIVFNLLMLWMIGSELEQRWGRRFFVGFYVGSGFGAAVIYTMGILIYSGVTGNQQYAAIPVVGASGAIFGLLLAYGILFGERVMHFMMLFPMKAKYFVMILGGIEVVSLLTSGPAGGQVANLAHLGGLIAGYAILIGWTLWQRRGWNQKKTKTRNLRLVVNNKPDDDSNKNGPKYWN